MVEWLIRPKGQWRTQAKQLPKPEVLLAVISIHSDAHHLDYIKYLLAYSLAHTL